jgi:chaperone BCS1
MFDRSRDIDCAFPSRDEEDEDEEPVLDKDGKPIGNRSPTPPRSAVTLSGLLNVLDSVSSEEGRLTFATVRFASVNNEPNSLG